jgi:lysophospholipase L1-like esterase
MSTGLYINNNLVNSWGHLNAKGYKIWANEVDKVLKKLGF